MEWFTNAAEQLYRGTIKPDEEGVYRGTGIGAFLLNPLVDEDALSQTKQQGAVKRRAASLDEDIGDLNLPKNATIYDVDGAVAKIRRDRESKKGDKDFTRQMRGIMAPVEATLKAQEIAADADRDIRNKQFLLTWQQGQNDRADARLQHADELALRREQMEREDMRYNENIARMDRKDRQQSIQTLVAGLANLGAAFAL